jgi:pSer/pThr/pTyr-binding forkhead associated (FHA) protein
VGGGIGGFLFDFLAGATQGGSTSRAVGFVCMGAAIGAAVSVIEEAVKDAWVTVLTGAKEGRSFILSKDQTTIGRNEMADIPLFGDASIQGNHAVILKSGDGYTITAAPGVFIAVNSQNVNSAGLADGDIISVGKQRMRFSSSGRRARVPVGVVQPVQQYVQTIPPAQNAQGYAYGEQTAISASRLQVLSGPHSGEVFNLNQSGGPMVLGRDPSSDIPLARDGMVSRRHAIILWDGGAWIIEDSGSTNGVFVNGTRVPRETLRPGSSIHVGESDIRVL